MKCFAFIVCLLPLVCFGQVENNAPLLLSTSPLRRGLIGYWRLEETSGIRYDCSKTGIKLTANNSPGATAGKQGNGATFVGTSTQSLTSTFSNITQNFTYAFWVKPTNNTDQGWVGFWSANNTQLLAYINSGQFQAWIGTNSSGSHLIVTSTTTFGPSNLNMSAGTWYFWVINYDSGTVTESINNNANTTYSSSSCPPPYIGTSTFSMGSLSDGTSSKCTGELDEVGIWNRTLTAAEITHLYNAGLATHFPWAHP